MRNFTMFYNINFEAFNPIKLLNLMGLIFV